MEGLPDLTESMMPRPIATSAMMTIQIGVIRSSTPVFHRASDHAQHQDDVPDEIQMDESHDVVDSSANCAGYTPGGLCCNEHLLTPQSGLAGLSAAVRRWLRPDPAKRVRIDAGVAALLAAAPWRCGHRLRRPAVPLPRSPQFSRPRAITPI